MSTGPKGRHGGARKGAGRKKSTLSELQTNALMRAVRKVQKEKGKPFWEVMVEMAYGDHGASPTNMLSASRQIADFTITKSSEQKITHEDRNAPMVGLPPEKKDPAQVIELVPANDRKVSNGK